MSAVEPIRFDGEVAVVTGAGRGLGRSYALELASRGAAVVCNDVDAGRATATAQDIVDRGGSAVPQTDSVSTPRGGAAIVQTAVDTFGSVDIVVNNAGQLRNAAFEDLSVEDVQQVLDTHLGGAFYVTQPAYRHMKAARYGRIIVTSSSAGMFGSPWQANYAAAKAGVVGLCNVLAHESARFGINVNAVMPMALTDINEGGPPPYSPEDLQETIDALRPLARYMGVENVTPLVVYLASRRCTVTRRIFSVGAGHISRVFIGTSPGWYAPGLGDMKPEQVEAKLERILDPDGFSVPESMNDECRLIAEHLPDAQ
jgi:NAD(P)-dependent dehydrogenase (short-subunit alcohol dehydrogenase family)